MTVKQLTLPGNEPPAITVTPQEPVSMLALAVERGMSPEVIGQLIAHQERIDAIRARKAFDNAMADAKAEIPVIKKNRHVGFASKKVGAASTDYYHEDLAEIARTIDPILAAHGLSYRFRTDARPNEPVTVTCIIAHRDGHFEENTLAAGRDDTGNKNSIQQMGSTVTYLQRYTLKAALGLAAAKDDDAQSAEAPPDDLVSDEQVQELSLALIEAKIPSDKFFKVFGIAALSELPAGRFAEAKKEIATVVANRAKRQSPA